MRASATKKMSRDLGSARLSRQTDAGNMRTDFGFSFVTTSILSRTHPAIDSGCEANALSNLSPAPSFRYCLNGLSSSVSMRGLSTYSL